MRILLITPENRFLKEFRRGQFNNFVQLTMPYLAGFVKPPHQVQVVDEYNQSVDLAAPADLVGITCNTPSASHVYRMADQLRERGRMVVLGGPHATLMPEEAKAHADAVVIGEAEETWPAVIADAAAGRLEPFYRTSNAPSLTGIPWARRDLIHRRGIAVQAGIVFGFDGDDEGTFATTLAAATRAGIDGATVSLLTPFPQTPVFVDLERSQRLLTRDWSYYNGKTAVAFRPARMTPEALWDGYMWFRRRFFSPTSVIERVWRSGVRPVQSLVLNWGYHRTVSNRLPGSPTPQLFPMALRAHG